MNPTSTNHQLQAAYQIYLDVIYSQSWDDNVSSPLLMHVFPEYAEMGKKVMFVGQETHNWGRMNKKLSVAELQDTYERFNLGKSADYNDEKPLRHLKSPFW